jgi:tetratricopeptide (TPR) repeat protein
MSAPVKVWPVLSTPVLDSGGRRHARRARWLAVCPLALVALGATACSSNGGSGAALSGTANQLVGAGLAAQQQGQVDQAKKDYQAALTKDPNNKYAYYDLGVIFQQAQDSTDATTNYRRALVIDPNFKPALFNMAVLETSSDPQGAIALYQQLLQLNPNDANVNFNLGLLLIAQGQSTQGHANLAKAIQIDPSLSSRLPAGTKP